MQSLTKNIAIALGVITIAFGGYYFYAQQGTEDASATANASVQQMLSSTEIFIARSQELDQVSLDMSFFEDKRFGSLQSFTKPLKDEPIGRSNPFATANTSTQ